MNLHLGCFDHPVDGWFNTDITPHIRVARVPLAATILYRLGWLTDQRYKQHRDGVFRRVHYMDVLKQFKLANDSVSAIYTSHMLEHLYPWDGERCLRECFRVLAPGGLLRIAVPDLDKLVSEFKTDSPGKFLINIYEYGNGMAKNCHRWHYNFSSLSQLLTSLGFSSVKRCEYKKGSCPDLENIESRPESLFVEAVK